MPTGLIVVLTFFVGVLTDYYDSNRYYNELYRALNVSIPGMWVTKAEGARVLGDGEPKMGAHGKPVLFLHPKDFLGTLVELEQA